MIPSNLLTNTSPNLPSTEAYRALKIKHECFCGALLLGYKSLRLHFFLIFAGEKFALEPKNDLNS